MKVIVPECPLALGSLKIVPHSHAESFSEWSDFNELETYELLQKIVRIWEKKGITDYLIYGKESNHSKSIFSWEIVPYPKDGWKFWKQFKVLWNIAFGSRCLPEVERRRIVKDFFLQPLTNQIESITKIAQGNDAFCNQKVIDKQLVFEGKEVNVLYDYAPIGIGEEKLHFLIVPKLHRLKFSDLTETEYLEAMQLSQKLISFYKDKGCHTAYLFDKTGAEAGQSVPHWHEHLIFAATKTQELFGKLTILKNMLIGSSPLSEKELQARVQSLQNELKEALS